MMKRGDIVYMFIAEQMDVMDYYTYPCIDPSTIEFMKGKVLFLNTPNKPNMIEIQLENGERRLFDKRFVFESYQLEKYPLKLLVEFIKS